MKKLFLLLFVLSLLIVNVKANEEDRLAASAEMTRRKVLNSEYFEPIVFSTPVSVQIEAKVKCVDGDTLYIYESKNLHLLGEPKLYKVKVVVPVRIAGIDAFDGESRKMIEKQKKSTGLSVKEIKKRAQKAKEYCEDYFIKQKKCSEFYNYGVDHYGRYIVIPCDGEYERNLVDKGLATIYKGNDLYKLIFDEDY